MSLVSFHCCLHSAASCMNSHCQQYDLAVPHAGSDPLRRVRFTAGAYCICCIYWMVADQHGSSSSGSVPSIPSNFCFNSNKCSLALLLDFTKCVVTDTSAKQSFRKLILIKTFNRSNMANSKLYFYFSFIGIFIHL